MPLSVFPNLFPGKPPMNPKVEITSKEMIKPSSPTPPHLQTLKLSLIDQMSPPIYLPFIFYYHKDDLKRSLKPSLSNVLTHFYPLAGRFGAEKLTLDCNDSGALFIETKVHANLSEMIGDILTMDDVDKLLLPLGRPRVSEDNTIVLAVQINLFNDGGIAVGCQTHHNLADGISVVNFMNAWAATSRGDEIIKPTFGSLSSVYPPRDFSSSSFEPTYGMADPNKIVTKHIVFDKSQLEKLKIAEMELSEVKDATRVEAVSAFFLRHFKAMSRAEGSTKRIGACQAVNLRPRMDPPLPFHTFGNVWMDSPGKIVDEDVKDLVGVMRIAIKKMNGDYIEEINRGGDEHLDTIYKADDLITCGFSSLWRLPFYDVDFGWGKPIWVNPAKLPNANQVYLMPTSSGEGMEAWVDVLQEDADYHFSHEM